MSAPAGVDWKKLRRPSSVRLSSCSVGSGTIEGKLLPTDADGSCPTPNLKAKEWFSFEKCRGLAGGLGCSVTRDSTNRIVPIRNNVSLASLNTAWKKVQLK